MHTHTHIQERDEARAARDFDQADALRDTLQQECGVALDDRLRQYWVQMTHTPTHPHTPAHPHTRARARIICYNIIHESVYTSLGTNSQKQKAPKIWSWYIAN